MYYIRLNTEKKKENAEQVEVITSFSVSDISSRS